MVRQVKIDVHAPHPSNRSKDFLVVRVEGSINPRVGDRMTEESVQSLIERHDHTVTQTGVWGSPKRT